MEIHPSSLIPHPSDSIAVLLLAFGGPENLDAVEPFLRNVLIGRPITPELVDRVKKKEEAVSRIIAMPMAPQASKASTGGYIDAMNKALEEVPGIEVIVAEAWYKNLLYLQAVADTVKGALKEFPEERRMDVQLIFSAHSLPKRTVEGDPDEE